MHIDTEVIVVDKPSGMLTVRGKPTGARSEASPKFQQFWVAAVQSVTAHSGSGLVCVDNDVSVLLARVAALRHPETVPRHRDKFVRFVRRHARQLQKQKCLGDALGADPFRTGSASDQDSVAAAAWAAIDKHARTAEAVARGADDERNALATVETWLAGRSGGAVGLADEALRCVHRLDMETSGLLVFARTATAAAHLSAQACTAFTQIYALMYARMHACTQFRREVAALQGGGTDERSRRTFDETFRRTGTLLRTLDDSETALAPTRRLEKVRSCVSMDIDRRTRVE